MTMWEPRGLVIAAGQYLVGPALLGVFLLWGLKSFPKTRLVAVGTVILYFLSLGGYLAWQHTVPKVFPDHYSWAVWHRTLESLETNAAYVIEVTALGQSRRAVNKSERHKWYCPDYSGFTYSKVRVEKVFSGSVQPGDIFEICEPYYRERHIEGLYLRTMEMYLPMRKGHRYLLFLDKSKWPLSAHMGKYVVHQGSAPDPNPEVLEVYGSWMGGFWEEYLAAYRNTAEKYFGD